MSINHTEKTMQRKPVIIDCDTGTDDAIAIIAALYSPELDVRAFTTVAGNVELQYTSRNTLNLVRELGFDTPVAVGAPQPIIRETIIHSGDNTHGDTGLGSVTLPVTDAPFSGKTAVQTIYDEALACGGELELIPVGPLTNIAQALMVHPDLKKMIKKITFMGGAMWGGNLSTTAEFNIWADPEAAKVVFAAGIPLTMVGLDVTLKAALNREDTAEIRAMGTRASEITADILDFMQERLGKGGEDLLMHDALAVGVCIHPHLVSMNHYFVDCEIHGQYTSGHTFVAHKKLFRKEPNCWVCEELDLPVFKNWLKGAIARSKDGC
jgi:inosine-uridine nucleoside N-ribohydrolase